MTPNNLTEADLDRLEDLLDADIFAGESMRLDEIQAMLCAIISGPEPVLPSVWLPEALGSQLEAAAGDPRLDEVVGLLLRLNNEIAAALLADETVAPLLYPVEEGSEDYDYDAWADAYAFGASLGGDWFEAAGKRFEELSELIEPIFILNGTLKEDVEAAGERWFSPADEARLVADIKENLPVIIQVLYNFWHNRGASPQQRDTPKIGRNDPCPCGSGKKFKQCCGRPDKLN